jgi:transposase
LKRWTAFPRFLDDGRVCRFYAAAELRGIAIGRGTRTFAGSDAGGQGAAAVHTPIETCELNDADPPARLAHVLAKARDPPTKRRDESSE